MLRRVWDEIGQDNMSIIAAGCAFYALLALFPAITALVSIYGLVADPATIEQQIALRRRACRRRPSSIVTARPIVAARARQAGLECGAGAPARALRRHLRRQDALQALNIAYEERGDRGFLRLNLIALAFTAGGGHRRCHRDRA